MIARQSTKLTRVGRLPCNDSMHSWDLHEAGCYPPKTDMIRDGHAWWICRKCRSWVIYNIHENSDEQCRICFTMKPKCDPPPNISVFDDVLVDSDSSYQEEEEVEEYGGGGGARQTLLQEKDDATELMSTSNYATKNTSPMVVQSDDPLVSTTSNITRSIPKMSTTKKAKNGKKNKSYQKKKNKKKIDEQSPPNLSSLVEAATPNSNEGKLFNESCPPNQIPSKFRAPHISLDVLRLLTKYDITFMASSLAAAGICTADQLVSDTAKRMLRERAGITIGTFIRLRCEAMTYINAVRM